jgi:hypothetical protein
VVLGENGALFSRLFSVDKIKKSNQSLKHYSDYSVLVRLRMPEIWCCTVAFVLFDFNPDCPDHNLRHSHGYSTFCLFLRGIGQSVDQTKSIAEHVFS